MNNETFIMFKNTLNFLMHESKISYLKFKEQTIGSLSEKDRKPFEDKMDAYYKQEIEGTDIDIETKKIDEFLNVIGFHKALSN